MKISHVLTLLFIVCCFYSNAQWVSKNGPEGGGTGSVVATSTTIFTAAYSTGIYRSTDGGATWIPSNTESGLTAEELHVSGNTVFAGGYGRPQVVRSTDQGLTWQAASTGIKITQSVTCFAENETGIWIGTGEGVLVTIDKGDNWVDKTGNLTQKGIRRIITKGSKVFAGTGAGLFVSANNDGLWTPVQIAGPNDGPILALNAIGNKIFVSLMNGGVYSSIDDGATWQESGTGIVNSSPAQFVQIGDKIYAPGVMSTFVSSNNGETWSPAGINGILVGSIISFNGKLIAASYPDGIMVSTNGADWTFSNTGLHGYMTSDFVLAGDKLFLTTTGSVFKTTTTGTWENANLLFTAPITLASKGDSIYVGTTSGLRLSTDKGVTWNQAGLVGEYSPELEFSTGAIYAVSDNSFFVSTDKGATWTSKTVGLPDQYFYCVAVKGSDVFVGTSRHGLYKSTNKGDTWTEVTTEFTTSSEFTVTDVLIDGENIYMTSGRRVYFSTDNAATWTEVTGKAQFVVNHLMSTGTHIYAATDNGIFVSAMGSDVWHNISFNLGKIKATKILSTAKSIIVGTNGRGVMEMSKTFPSELIPKEGLVGATIAITGGLFGGSADKNIVDFNGTIATISKAEVMKLEVKVPAGATSGPVKVKVGDITIDAGTFTVREAPIPEEPVVTGIDDTDETKFVVSPNPFRNSITINTPGTVHFRLMDTMGKQIMKADVNGTVELPELSPGVYFATITADGNTRTVKLMKVE